MKRRQFLVDSTALLAAAITAKHALADSSSTYVAPVPADTGAVGHVVVIGGGMAGATVAKYLRVWGGARVKVTMIDRSPNYVSNIMSNLVLTGARTLSGLTYTWDRLAANYGITRWQGEVDRIDAQAKVVSLTDGRTAQYDRLVIAPGIAFDDIAGIETDALRARYPHAWQAGAATNALRDQIRAMTGSDRFVMTIPKAPYRCPPGPYERACVVADWLKRNRPGAKVLVLDENPGIVAERESFNLAFTKVHAGVIEYVPNAIVQSIDPGTNRVFTTMGDFAGKVINPIPRQRAPKVLRDAGMLNAANAGETELKWTKVDALSYEHLDSARFPGVHVIGDAATHGMPKAGHVANMEAKICADAITRYLRGDRPMSGPVANSACYSPITASTASWLTAVYQYDPTSRQMKVFEYAPGQLATGEAGLASKDNFEEMNKWFRQLMVDSFA